MDTAMLIGSFIPIIAILLGGLILLVPIAGLTARFALKPAIDSYVRLRSSPGSDENVTRLEQRLTLVEQQLHAMEGSLRRLEEDADFQRQLSAPARNAQAENASRRVAPAEREVRS